MRDLAIEFRRLGHEPTIIVPDSSMTTSWTTEHLDEIEVLRLGAPKTKDVGRIRRALAESRLSYAMRRNYAISPIASRSWDGVIWYSPTIFLGPFVRYLKKRSKCPGYLILRDLFPEWAVDTGVMRRNLFYLYFKAVEKYQYKQADTIGVQTPANLGYFAGWQKQRNGRLEVLSNWLAPLQTESTRTYNVSAALDEKTILVYAGNMGVAQGMDCLIELADAIRDRNDIAMLFVGRGTEVPRLKLAVDNLKLSNVHFHNEVEPEHLPDILAQCDIGLLALDPRHRTHNIPGKFLSYLRAGLPVLARVNSGNDLVEMINSKNVGRVTVEYSGAELKRLCLELVDCPELRREMGPRARLMANCEFSPSRAAIQIIRALVA